MIKQMKKWFLVSMLLIPIMIAGGSNASHVSGSNDPSPKKAIIIDPVPIKYLTENVEYTIRNVNTGMFFDLKYRGTTSGTEVEQYHFGGDTNQRFKFKYLSTNVYEIIPVSAPTMRLDVNGGYATENRNIHLYSSNDSNAQKFKFAYRSGMFTIATGASNYERFLTVASNAENEDIIQQANPVNGKWYIEKFKELKVGEDQTVSLNPLLNGNFGMLVNNTFADSVLYNIRSYGTTAVSLQLYLNEEIVATGFANGDGNNKTIVIPPVRDKNYFLLVTPSNPTTGSTTIKLSIPVPPSAQYGNEMVKNVYYGGYFSSTTTPSYFKYKASATETVRFYAYHNAKVQVYSSSSLESSTLLVEYYTDNGTTSINVEKDKSYFCVVTAGSVYAAYKTFSISVWKEGDFSKYVNPKEEMHYNGNNTINVWFNTSSGYSTSQSLINVSNYTYRYAFETAMRIWSAVGRVKFVEVSNEAASNLTVSAYYEKTDGGYAGFQPLSWTQVNGVNLITKARLFFNMYSPAQTLNHYIEIALHEFGHSLGIGEYYRDFYPNKNVMADDGNGRGIGTGTLGPDDIRGYQYIYN